MTDGGDGLSEAEDEGSLPVRHHRHAPKASSDDEESDGNRQEAEDEEEEEPRLKYATLTKNTSSVYRSGDALSTCLVAGDKLIAGTHNGHIHVFNLPSFIVLKVYHAHKASVSSVSISPFPPPTVSTKLDAAQRLAAESLEGSERPGSGSPGAKNSPRQAPVPKLPSNQIHIATSSIDGNVCIQSLVDPNDVQLRNFGRPVLAVALSPDYKTDRSYLSGGQGGSLVLTTGGVSGRSTDATTTSVGAAASGWLGSFGLGSNTGTDKVLHSGEGAISTIKWSLSGKYVLWVNEQGIKVMRSSLQLSGTESGTEWRRFSHINRPKSPAWDEMAGVWKARADWINRDTLEVETEAAANGNTLRTTQTVTAGQVEEVCVGWGDAAWIIRVFPETPTSKPGEGRKGGVAEIATFIRFDDCTICGISLYTPGLLLILAHMEKKNSKKTADGARKGRQHKRNALEPELRLIDITSKEEVDADTLTMSRFESLTPSDYHLTVLPRSRIPTSLVQKGYLEVGVNAIGSGIETVGQGVWDATMYGPRKLGADRLFSGNESVRSSPVGPNQTGSMRNNNYLTGWIPGFVSSGLEAPTDTQADVAISQSMKVFIFSPYDCIVAVKRNLADRVKWLAQRKRLKEAWELLDQHPEAAGLQSDTSDSEAPSTPSKASSITQSGSAMSPSNPARTRQQATLAEFFADSTSITSSRTEKHRFPAASKEKRRVGELWLQQMREHEKWTETAEVATKVLETSDRWEYWIWEFIRNKKFDEITPIIPTFQLQPPLPSSTFEIILAHYVVADRRRFKELIDQWPSDIFEISSISAAILDQLQSGIVVKGSQDWRLLQESLAKLYVADGHFKEALQCYISLQDADTAMTLVKEHHLVDVIADDIPAFVLLRIPKSHLKSASQEELQDLSSESINLLVDEATQGIVEPDEVVTQLDQASLALFLFFYLRALWHGHSNKSMSSRPRIGQVLGVMSLDADQGKAFVEQFADRAIELFAEYDRELLMEFLHSSNAYTFDKAAQICERRHYINEWVYLLSKTGDLRKALFLIIDELKDVSKAIAFAKEQDDKGLWDDLLDYSMSRPRFISGLLAEVGTAIDPITLLRRIPSGLEVEGLKDGLKKMIREYDLQDSISEGVARVLSSEVAVGMETLRRGRRRGIKFDVTTGAKKMRSREFAAPSTQGVQEPQSIEVQEKGKPVIGPGHCTACGRAFPQDETETLVGFACGHVYHATHLFHNPDEAGGQGTPPPETEQEDTEDALFGTFKRTIGLKVTNARLLRDRIAALGGCRICKKEREDIDDT